MIPGYLTSAHLPRRPSNSDRRPERACALQLRVQVEGFAGDYVDLLRVRRAARFANLDMVTARTQVHRLVVMRCACVGAIDEYSGILHFRVQLDLA